MSARIKILTVVYIVIFAGIIILADINGTKYFRFIQYLPYGDKVGHFVLMGFLSLMVNLALRARNFQIWKFKYLLGSLIVTAVVLVEEISQIFIRGRTFDLGDLLFGFVGIVIFGEIARIVCRKTLKS